MAHVPILKANQRVVKNGRDSKEDIENQNSVVSVGSSECCSCCLRCLEQMLLEWRCEEKGGGTGFNSSFAGKKDEI